MKKFKDAYLQDLRNNYFIEYCNHLSSEEVKPNKKAYRCFISNGAGHKTPAQSTTVKDTYLICGCCGRLDIIGLYAKQNGLDAKKDFVEVVKGLSSELGLEVEYEQEQGNTTKYSSGIKKYWKHIKKKFAKENTEVITHAYYYTNAKSERKFVKYRADIEPKSETIKPKQIAYRTIEYDAKGGDFTDADSISAREFEELTAYGDFKQYAPQELVFYVEGEKCVDAMRDRGYKNVITFGSCADANILNFKDKDASIPKYQQEVRRIFKDINLIILQDNDKNGLKCSQTIKDALKDICNSVRVMTPYPYVDEGDIADFFLNGGGTTNELNQMIERTPFEVVGKVREFTISDTDKPKYHLLNDKGKIKDVFDKAIADNVIKNVPMLVVGEEIYLYSNGAYVLDALGKVTQNHIKKHILDTYIKDSTVKRVKNLIASDIRLDKQYEDLNNYPTTWINFKDCFVDAVTLKVYPHSPNYNAINQCPHSYKDVFAAEQGKETEKFFDFVFGDDADTREMFLQYLGYCLTQDNTQQKMLFLKGKGGCGKSILLNLATSIIGKSNISSLPLQKLQDRFSLASLLYKTVNICADIPSDKIENISIVKTITGNDANIDIEEKFAKRDLNVRLNTRFMFSVNEFPTIMNERNNGIWRRFLIIPFEKTPTEEDANLTSKLEKEILYLIKLSVQAVSRMYNSESGKMLISETSAKIVNQLTQDSDVVEAFTHNSDYCTLDAEEKENRKYLFTRFLQYCEEFDRKPLTKNGFFKAMRLKFGEEVRDNKGNQFYRGLKLSEDTFKDMPDSENPFFKCVK